MASPTEWEGSLGQSSHTPPFPRFSVVTLIGMVAAFAIFLFVALVPQQPLTAHWSVVHEARHTHRAITRKTHIPLLMVTHVPQVPPSIPGRVSEPSAPFTFPAAPASLAVSVALGLAGAALVTAAMGRLVRSLRADGATFAMAASSGDPETVQAPPGFKPPTPKKFTVPEGQLVRVLAAAAPAAFRFYNGLFVVGWTPSITADDDGQSYSFLRTLGRRVVERSAALPPTRPSEPIQLWEYQGSPYCRKVREACCVLDLDVQYFPCPQDGPTYRPEAKAKGWKTFPHMVDPNTGAEMGESDDIVAYLFRTYGGGQPVPFLLSGNPFNTALLYISAIVRYRPGSVYVPSRKPAKPLELWAYEPAPFSVIAREVLSELELPHIVHYCPRGSVHREEVFRLAGTCQLPYLEDPNTGVKMFESTEIAKYLYDVYAVK
jgi:glutathione S-transferase